MMQKILMNLPAQFMPKQRLFCRPSDYNLNQTIPTRLMVHKSCVNQAPLVVRRAPFSMVCVSPRMSAVKKKFLTADGRRQVPDDVSGREARGFQLIFTHHFLSAVICVGLR